jgi:hypothetical protein
LRMAESLAERLIRAAPLAVRHRRPVAERAVTSAQQASTAAGAPRGRAIHTARRTVSARSRMGPRLYSGSKGLAGVGAAPALSLGASGYGLFGRRQVRAAKQNDQESKFHSLSIPTRLLPTAFPPL